METPTWLMLFYQLPAQPSTQRVYVWRKLKTLGTVYLQHSVGILPATDEKRHALTTLCREIEARGGEARISSVQLTDSAECADLISKFKAQSDEEYQEFLGKCRDFAAELAKERKADHFTFAELEENEVELAKLNNWLPVIAERDFFGAGRKPAASKALKAAAQDLEKYAKQVAAKNLNALPPTTKGISRSPRLKKR